MGFLLVNAYNSKFHAQDLQVSLYSHNALTFKSCGFKFTSELTLAYIIIHVTLLFVDDYILLISTVFRGKVNYNFIYILSLLSLSLSLSLSLFPLSQYIYMCV